MVWKGPGITPLAVVAVWHLHGPQAMIEHPGLAVLRQAPGDTEGAGSHRVLRPWRPGWGGSSLPGRLYLPAALRLSAPMPASIGCPV